MEATTLVYSENELGKVDGKVANGLVRQSDKYKIVGIIDSTKAGLDAGEYLDGIKNGIPVFCSIENALENLGQVPEYFIYGIAPLSPFLSSKQREVILRAMTKGMNIVNGLPEFLSEDEEFVQKMNECGVKIYDIRRPSLRHELHMYSGYISKVKTPVIAVLGTDCAVGKRTTTLKLVNALEGEGLKAVFIATGQTGILQGSKYGVALDVLSSGFATGELEHVIIQAYENETPDIIIVEGQGALSHPAFTSSCSIIKGAMPDAVIIQHPPKRENHCDYPDIPMPSLDNEIRLIEAFSGVKVIAITINHENMTEEEVKNKIFDFEFRFDLPATDVLTFGCDKLVRKLFEIFPELMKPE